MLLKDFNLDDYLFGPGRDDYSAREVRDVQTLLQREIVEIFYGRTLART
jgi:S-adenosylmethionine decarboxylase